MRYYAEPVGQPPTEHASFTAAITVLRGPGRVYSTDDDGSHEHTILVRDPDLYLHRP